MSINKEEIKQKISEKLPTLLPKLVKTVVVHIVMLIYHISMPPWVTAMKIKKSLNALKKETEPEASRDRSVSRRRMRRMGRRYR